MFQKVFEYAGPHKKGLYAATAVVLVSVLMGVLPFVLAYQVIAPLVMGAELDASFLILRVALVLVCLVLQAVLYGWGLNLSHKAAYDTLLRLRTALQKRFEKLPLGVIQDKGTGTVKKLFVDDVDSLEVLLAHSMPEGIANLMVPIAVYVAMFFVDWKLALLSLASIPISLIAMMTMYSVGMKKMGPYYMAGQKMNNTIIEYINGMEVVKVFNKDADSYERFRKDVSDYRDYTLAWYKAAWPWMAIYSSLLPCTVILTLPLGAWFVLSGWSALPDLILVLCLSLSIGMPLLKSLGFLPTMPQLNYKISALEQVLDAPELQQTPDSFHGKDDTIVYDHVSFGYTKTQPGPDGKPMVVEDEVLHDISFTAKAGQKTALVGESGSGKSTLASVLAGNERFEVTEGEVLFEGRDLLGMPVEERARAGLFLGFQYPVEIPGVSMANFMKMAVQEQRKYRGEEPLTASQFLRLMKEKSAVVELDPKLMSRSVNEGFSGGEKKKNEIFQMAVLAPKLAILDETDSGLDIDALRIVATGVTKLRTSENATVVITHYQRLLDYIVPDYVHVLYKGRIIHSGDKSLALKLEKEGYDWLINDYREA